MDDSQLSMRIHGTMYGGLKVGTSLHSDLRGPAVVDFTYRKHVEERSGS